MVFLTFMPRISPSGVFFHVFEYLILNLWVMGKQGAVNAVGNLLLKRQ